MQLQKSYQYVFVATIFLGEDEQLFMGGAELHLNNIVQVLSESNSVLIIQMGKADKVINYSDNVDVCVIKANGVGQFKRRANRVIKDIKTDWVHYNYEKLVSRSRDESITYSATFHGVAWDFPTSNFPNKYFNNQFAVSLFSKFRKLYFVYFTAKTIQSLDKVLSVDTSLVRLSQQFLTSHRNKINTIYNFVDTSKFYPQKKLSQTFTIFFPRNFSFARGVHLLIPIVKQLRASGLKSFKIILAGSGIKQIGGNKYKNTLIEEIKKNKLLKYFQFQGRISNDQMSALYNQSHLTMIPTFFSEGTSLACLESMACATPVITTNIGGLNDIVIDNFNGFLAQPTIDSITDKILHVHKLYREDQKELQRITNNGLSLVEQCWDVSIWQAKVREYFNQKSL